MSSTRKQRKTVLYIFSVIVLLLPAAQLLHSQQNSTQISASSAFNIFDYMGLKSPNSVQAGLSVNQEQANMSMNSNLMGLERNAARYGYQFNVSLVAKCYSIDVRNIEKNESFLNYGINNLATWSLKYNFSTYNLTVYATFQRAVNNSASVYVTFSSNTSVRSIANVEMSISMYYTENTSNNVQSTSETDGQVIGTENWGGYDLYHESSSGALSPLISVSGNINVPTVYKPPNPYGHTVPPAVATWIGLTATPGGNPGNGQSAGIGQTGIERTYYWVWFFGWDLIGNPYKIWYESYPYSQYYYSGSPDMQPGMEADFTIFNNYMVAGEGNGFTYSAYVPGIATFQATYTSLDLYTYYANFITEAPKFGSTIGQIAKFSPAFEITSGTVLTPTTLYQLGVLYDSGFYYKFVLSQQSGETNIQDSFTTSGNYGYPTMTWENSDYDL